MTRTCCCRQLWQVQIKVHQPLFFLKTVCQRTLKTLVFSFFSIETAGAVLVRAFWQPFSSLTLWVGPRILNKRRVYGTFWLVFPWLHVYTWARDFKFAGVAGGHWWSIRWRLGLLTKSWVQVPPVAGHSSLSPCFHPIALESTQLYPSKWRGVSPHPSERMYSRRSRGTWLD